MLQNDTHHRRPVYLLPILLAILLGVAFGVLYWIVDSGIDALLFRADSFVVQLLSPEPKEIYMRLSVACLGLAYSIYACVARRQRLAVAEALRQSETRYRTLVEGSLQGISVTWNGERLFANTAFARILGYDDPQALIGQPIRNHVARHEWARLRQNAQSRARGESVPARYEYQGVRKDGTPLWLEAMVTLVSWEGQPARLATLVDVTERKKAEAALRESEERFRILVESSLAGIYIFQDGRFRYVNPTFAAIFGYTPEEIMTTYQDGRALIADEDLPLVRANVLQRLRRETDSHHYTFRGKRKDGGLIEIEVHSTVVSFQGKTAIIGTLLDITARKRAEGEHQRLEAQLRQFQKMEAIGTLAGGIAHDFNNILVAIIGYTELIQYEMPQVGLAWQNLQEIGKAARRAKALVQQILTFSRQMEGERHPVRLATLVRETLALLRASLPTTIELRCDLPEDGDTIFAVPIQIHQILMNLCANAEYAMRQSGGLLDISVMPVDVDAVGSACHLECRPGPYVRLAVRDTGTGMMPEVRERIFDPFFTTKEVGQGTGMGLAMVHGIVANHDGVISVDSMPGEGTTFAIYLPRLSAPVDTIGDATDDIAHGTEHILFVDDEPAITYSIPTLLEMLGYQVDAITSGHEALDRFRSAPETFDLVVTDQTMPQMTGEHLARELRRIRPDIPIILCTGFSHVIDADRAQAVGIDAFCMKPLTAQELAQTIQNVLRNRVGQKA